MRNHLSSEAMNVQWSVMMTHNFFHPHPVHGTGHITTLYMEFVGMQEFWSRKKLNPYLCLKSGRCEHCDVDNEDYNTLVFKSRLCLEYR